MHNERDKSVILNYAGPYPEPYLIVSSRNEIAIVDLTSVYSKSIIDGKRQHKAIRNFNIDPLRKILYFQDGMSIYQSKLDGSNATFVSKNERNFDIWKFAFDWLGKRLFWVRWEEKRIILVGSVDLQNLRWFVNHEEDILNLAVDPSYG